MCSRHALGLERCHPASIPWVASQSLPGRKGTVILPAPRLLPHGTPSLRLPLAAPLPWRPLPAPPSCCSPSVAPLPPAPSSLAQAPRAPRHPCSSPPPPAPPPWTAAAALLAGPVPPSQARRPPPCASSRGSSSRAAGRPASRAGPAPPCLLVLPHRAAPSPLQFFPTKDEQRAAGSVPSFPPCVQHQVLLPLSVSPQ
ncbi:hypothetical protein BS78_08G070800 [Paspalum vaginatum]|nr:hypothetical protein BS78_08G070800 [Paspalum vaginatum]